MAEIAADEPEPGFATQLREDLGEHDMLCVLTVFGNDLVRLTCAIDDAAQAGDAGLFCHLAHGLSGAAGAVGAKRLAVLCRIAMLDSGGDTPTLERHAAAIAAAASEARAALERATAVS